ncbi:MAG TPA: carboxypeptidase regulatory-like domain-containing protein [Chitinivibrionales bacterium]|nr:carboxypeptidase regulatory-like domain-containing protein [Chitinivibrionales bacterium]
MVRKISLVFSILAATIFTVNAGTVTGVVDSGTAPNNKPLAGVIVTLTPAFGGGASYSDTTLATGDYSIANVPAGVYAPTATLDGFTPYAGANIVVTANGTVTRNINLVPLPPGITISGAVKDSVSGDPLAGALVRLRTIGGGATTVDSVIVGTNGQYSLTHVQAGTYNLVASAAGHTAKTVRTVVAAVDITQDFLLVGLPAGVAISGSVKDSVSGTPLAGGKVYLRTGGIIGGTIIDSAVVGTNGSYSLDSVQPGTYSVIATAAGHTSKTVNGVAVANTAVTEDFMLVGLPAGVTVSGLVDDSIRGTPLAGAIVYLRTAAGAGGGTILDSAVAGSNGSYTIDSVQPGNYRLEATATGHTAKTVAITVAAAPVTQSFLLASLPGVTISGQVADSTTGQPLGGAVVKILSGGLGGTVVDTAVVAANGTYTLTDIPAGTYTMTVNKANYGTKVKTVTVAATPLTEDFLMVPGVGVTTLLSSAKSRVPQIMLAAGMLHLANFSEAGTVSLLSISGKLVYRTGITANTTMVVLPKTITSGMYLVNVTQKSTVYNKQVVMP